jgi:hypothetical protein
MWFRSYRELSQYIQNLVPNYGVSSDSIIFEDPPVRCLEYPLRVGAQWTYREAGNPWHMDKKVLRKRRFEVEAGDFSCFEIRWLYDFDNDGSWDEDIWITDYMSSIGLVDRRIFVGGSAESDEYGNELGFIDSFDEYELLSHGADHDVPGLPLEPPGESWH